MKTIYTKKYNSRPIPQPPWLRHLFKQMIAGILNRQTAVYKDEFQSDVIQRLNCLEDKIDAFSRSLGRQRGDKLK